MALVKPIFGQGCPYAEMQNYNQQDDGSHYGQRQIEFVHRLSCFRHPKFQDKSAGAEHKGDEHGLGQGIVQADEDNSQDGNS